MTDNTTKWQTWKTKLILVALGIFILISSCCIIPYYALGYGCLWGCAPKRDFTVYDLNLPSELLPIRLSTGLLVLHPDRGTVGATEEAIGDIEGVAVYKIIRFDSITKALKWYAARTRSQRFTSALENPLQLSQALKFKSENADEFQVTCGHLSVDLSCYFEARYQEYYVFFRGSIGDGKMKPEEFVNVISYIDQKFGELLKVDN
jgi:hypothetical protein